MIVYWLLLVPVAFIAYMFGSMSTIVLASNFVFKTNLNKLGRGNDWLSNFSRIYGIKGALGLLLVEAVKDAVPIIIGGLLLSIKGHGDVGRAFAAFCIVMGRLWPIFYNLKGSHAVMPMIIAGLFADTSLGIVVALLFLVILWLTKYVTVASVAAAVALAAAAVLIVESRIVIYLLAFTALAVLIKHVPAIRRFAKGGETKYSFNSDITYKFDEKFDGK